MKSISDNLHKLLPLLLIGIGSFTVKNVNAQQIITIERTIEIKVGHESVLDYVSDLLKDPVWRAEVDSMILIQSNKYGNGAIEYSSFGKKNKTVTPTFQTSKTGESITFETPDTAKYWLASIRTVERIDDHKTLLTYTLKFDNYMTKEISPFKIPKWITKMFYGNRMKKYLKVLKEELEK